MPNLDHIYGIVLRNTVTGKPNVNIMIGVLLKPFGTPVTMSLKKTNNSWIGQWNIIYHVRNAYT